MNKTVFGDLLHLVASLRGDGLAQKCGGDEPPLRSELFSNEQMEQHGKTLAGSHRVGSGHAPDQLLTRLAENEGVLIEVRKLLLEPVETSRRCERNCSAARRWSSMAKFWRARTS